MNFTYMVAFYSGRDMTDNNENIKYYCATNTEAYVCMTLALHACTINEIIKHNITIYSVSILSYIVIYHTITNLLRYNTKTQTQTQTKTQTRTQTLTLNQTQTLTQSRPPTPTPTRPDFRASCIRISSNDIEK